MKSNEHLQAAKQKGTALVEATLALLVILFLAGLCIELAQMHQTRYLSSLALQEAARVAAVTHANPLRWRPILAQGLRPTYASAVAEQRHTGMTQREGLHPYYPEVLSPEGARQAQDKPFVIKPRRHGQPTDAVLHLRLTYVYVPKQPWLRSTIKAIAHLSTAQKSRHSDLHVQMRSAGMVPIVVEHKILMQSDLPD